MINRTIDVNKLDDEQLNMAIEKISGKITAEVDATCDRVNELINRYGFKCKMQIVFEELKAGNKASDSDIIV